MLSDAAHDLYKLIMEWHGMKHVMGKPEVAENTLAKVKERYFSVFEKVCTMYINRRQ